MNFPRQAKRCLLIIMISLIALCTFTEICLQTLLHSYPTECLPAWNIWDPCEWKTTLHTANLAIYFHFIYCAVFLQIYVFKRHCISTWQRVFQPNKLGVSVSETKCAALQPSFHVSSLVLKNETNAVITSKNCYLGSFFCRHLSSNAITFLPEMVFANLTNLGCL